MAKFKFIEVGIYKRGIHVFIGNHRDFKRWVAEYFADDDEYQGLIDYVQEVDKNDALASFWYNGNTGDGIIEIPKFPRTPKEIAYCAHECLHATFHMLDYVGIEYDKDDSGEAHTYLLEYLLKNLLEIDNYYNA